ncbi:MAG TPA: glycosyltransferase [Candidatus Obscuribacterales bacterium]
MKIAFLVKDFPVLSQTFILNQITGLIDRGHSVTIFALHGSPDPGAKCHGDVDRYDLLSHTRYPPRRPRQRVLRVLKAMYLLATRWRCLPWRVLPLLNVQRYGRDAFSLKLLYRAVVFLGAGKFDVVHSQFGTVGLEGLTYYHLGLIQGAWVTTFRGSDISSVPQKRGSSIYQPLWKSGDFFMANCQFFRQRAIDLGCPPGAIVVHGSGINCERFTFSARSLPAGGAVHLVTVGRLVEKKGIEYGIQAIAELLRSHPHRSLTYSIVGEGPLRAPLQRLIDELELGPWVKLLGQMAQDELIEVLDSAHIFLAPCITAESGDQDAPVNTLKEAMAMGLPVVSTYHGGIPELVKDGESGFLVAERDVEGLVGAIAALIDHPEQWPAMGRAGRLAVEAHYDTHQLNDELVTLYQQLLSPAPAVSTATQLCSST